MNLLSQLFGCWHANTSRVFTLRNQRGKKETYIVCLDCGRPFAYDWEEMSIVSPRKYKLALKEREI